MDKVYDLRINNRGKIEVMSYGHIEDIFSMSMCEFENIRMIRVKGKSGKPLIIRYIDDDRRYIEYINKHYQRIETE